jgi:heme A synthase
MMVLKWTAGIFAALMLLQSILGGRGFFVDSDLLDVHRTVGMITVLVALVQVVLAFTTVRASGPGRPIVIMSALIFILAIVQLMLGFSAKDGSSESASWHLLNGVLIFGLAVGNNSIIFRLRRD